MARLALCSPTHHRPPFRLPARDPGDPLGLGPSSAAVQTDGAACHPGASGACEVVLLPVVISADRRGGRNGAKRQEPQATKSGTPRPALLPLGLSWWRVPSSQVRDTSRLPRGAHRSSGGRAGSSRTLTAGCHGPAEALAHRCPGRECWSRERDRRSHPLHSPCLFSPPKTEAPF